MEVSSYVRPRSLDEAYTLLTQKNAFVIGGGAWSRMSLRRVETAIDLSLLNLRFIKKTDTYIEIGAMTTARELETSSELEEAFGSLFKDTVAHIVGVQMRNIVTIGGTVAGKYGFSDLNTTLLALNARIVPYNGEAVDFEQFLLESHKEAFLIEKIVIDTFDTKGAFQSIRNTQGDFSILNVAAAKVGGSWRIAVGARPGAARLAREGAKVLEGHDTIELDLAEKAAKVAAQELSFGKDLRADAAYRQNVCLPLVRRAIMEVAK